MSEFSIHIDKKRLAQHTIFWMCWIFGFTFIQSFGFGMNDFMAWLVYYLVTLPLFMTHTYLIAYWFAPTYFFRHRYGLFGLWVIILLIISSVIELVISNEVVWSLVKPENKQAGNYLGWQNILINGLGNEYVIIAFLSVKVIRFWNLKMGEKTDLLNRKMSTEIELLKIQSYPRFLLNVADKLEDMAKNHSPQTPEMIIRLSNLMNCMISNDRSETILLQKEVALIKGYIYIQMISYPVDYPINFEVSGKLNGIRIPPFLFFQVVEEGFLILDVSEKNTDCSIHIKTEPHHLLFSMTIWNDSLLGKQFNSGVIENCQKYLGYFYPENHMVISNFEINFVEVSIEINTEP